MKKYNAAVIALVVGCFAVYFYTLNSRTVEHGEGNTGASNSVAKTNSIDPESALSRESALAFNKGAISEHGYSPAENKRYSERSRLFEISRSTNDSTLRHKLREAREQDLISTNEYYGELAHMLSTKTPENLEIFKEIAASKNGYGIEVMFSIMAQNTDWAKQLPSAEQDSIFSKLKALQPTFSGPVSELGMSDVYRYENWIRSLENSYTGNNFNLYLAKEVVAQAPEPRDYLALSYAGYIDRLRTAGDYPVVAAVDKVLESYRKSYPNNDSSNVIHERQGQRIGIGQAVSR